MPTNVKEPTPLKSTASFPTAAKPPSQSPTRSAAKLRLLSLVNRNPNPVPLLNHRLEKTPNPFKLTSSCLPSCPDTTNVRASTSIDGYHLWAPEMSFEIATAQANESICDELDIAAKEGHLQHVRLRCWWSTKVADRKVQPSKLNDRLWSLFDPEQHRLVVFVVDPICRSGETCAIGNGKICEFAPIDVKRKMKKNKIKDSHLRYQVDLGDFGDDDDDSRAMDAEGDDEDVMTARSAHKLANQMRARKPVKKSSKLSPAAHKARIRQAFATIKPKWLSEKSTAKYPRQPKPPPKPALPQRPSHKLSLDLDMTDDIVAGKSPYGPIRRGVGYKRKRPASYYRRHHASMVAEEDDDDDDDEQEDMEFEDVDMDEEEDWGEIVDE